MPEYNKPKLFESLRYGGECVVCGDEIEAGFPGWVLGKNCACPTHKPDAVVDAVDALKTGDREKTRAPEQMPVAEALKGLDESLARIAHILEMTYNAPRDPK